MGTLYYLPLEPYKERYTGQLVNWHRKAFDKAGIVAWTVHGNAALMNDQTIRTGQVIDPTVRAKRSFSQIESVLHELSVGRVKADDVILLDDFWTPGMEALPYAFHQADVKPKVYAYWWAQSVDEYDFTAKMGNWMIDYERMGLEFMDGVFVACPSLKKLIVERYGDRLGAKVHVVGLPFDSEEVLSRMPANYQFAMRSCTGETPTPPRKNQVVFSSRWDWEKQPDFFITVAEKVKKVRPDVNFVVTTSAPRLRSNTESLLVSRDYAEKNNLIEFREGLTKEEYYAVLCESKVQFNCALQDWVSFTLLEALTAGCVPIYPAFRSFPETFGPRQNFLYQPFFYESAVEKILDVLTAVPDYLWDAGGIKVRQDVMRPHDDTTARMLNVMFPDLKLPVGNLPWEE